MLTTFKTLLAFFEMFFGLSLILSSVLVKFSLQNQLYHIGR